MVSLASLVAAHGSVLVADAASTQVQVGLLRASAEPRWVTAGDDASVHLFTAAADLLAAAGLKPSKIGAYVFCDGPGSQLGIRTVCIALRTWQTLRSAPAPVFAYRSLEIAALAHARTGTGGFAVIADARREAWHAVRTEAGGPTGKVFRASHAEVGAWTEPLLQPEGYRSWSPPPRAAGTCAYECRTMWAALADEPLLFSVETPSPWQSAAVAYQTWTGERHRAPAAQQAAAQQ